MDAQTVREYLLKLPHVQETIQWGSNLVFWVGEKSIGGKMFAVLNLEPAGGAVLSFCAGPERYEELLEMEDVLPAPYMARHFWISLKRWDVLSASDLLGRLAQAHIRTYNRLSPRTRNMLASTVIATKGRAGDKGNGDKENLVSMQKTRKTRRH